MDFALTEIEPMQSANCLLHSCIHSVTKRKKQTSNTREQKKNAFGGPVSTCGNGNMAINRRRYRFQNHVAL